MGRYLKGIVDERVIATGLAARTLVSATFQSVVNEKTFVYSIFAAYAMDSFTKAVDDGPMMVGVAHSDYTDAEIEEVIENTGSWNEGDLINQEVGSRKVRIIGIFDNPATATELARLNDGKKIQTKLGLY